MATAKVRVECFGARGEICLQAGERKQEGRKEKSRLGWKSEKEKGRERGREEGERSEGAREGSKWLLSRKKGERERERDRVRRRE